ncbi:15582_t:CDS:2 [Gigaspora rosea]|nr:15582_t:CDS:2 [Gigaspora rosea]
MNEEQFNKFIEAMTKSASREELKTLSKETSEANNWAKDRRVKIASEYLKEMVAEWYRRIREICPGRKITPVANGVVRITTKDMEKVDIYATKFQKLLNRVNVDNGFFKGFIIRMFLKGLKGKNAELVNIAAPKNLDDAIAAAKRIEA